MLAMHKLCPFLKAEDILIAGPTTCAQRTLDSLQRPWAFQMSLFPLFATDTFTGLCLYFHFPHANEENMLLCLLMYFYYFQRFHLTHTIYIFLLYLSSVSSLPNCL